MWERLSKREQIMIVILGLVLILSIYYLFLFQPLQGKIALLEKERSGKEKELAQVSAMVKMLPELNNRHNELLLLQKDPLNIEKLLEIIEETSRQSGVRLISLTPLEKEKHVFLDILIRGSYRNFNIFLINIKKIENNVRFGSLFIRPDQDELLLKIGLFSENEGLDGGDNN